MNEQAIVAGPAVAQDRKRKPDEAVINVINLLLAMPGRGEPGRPEFPLPPKDVYDEAIAKKDLGQIVLFQVGVGFVALGDDASLVCEAMEWDEPEELETSLGRIRAVGLSPDEAATLQFRLPNTPVNSNTRGGEASRGAPDNLSPVVMAATLFSGSGRPIIVPSPWVVGDDIAAGRRRAYRCEYFTVLFQDNAKLARETLGLESSSLVPDGPFAAEVATISFGELKRLQDSLGDDRLEEVEVDADKMECITLQTGLDSVPAA